MEYVACKLALHEGEVGECPEGSQNKALLNLDSAAFTVGRVFRNRRAGRTAAPLPPRSTGRNFTSGRGRLVLLEQTKSC